MSTSIIERTHRRAHLAVDAIVSSAEAVCVAIANENAALANRDDHKASLVALLVGTNNPLSGKPHSATSAAEAAERDDVFGMLDAERKRGEADRIRAWAAYEAVKCRAHLAIIAAGGALT